MLANDNLMIFINTDLAIVLIVEMAFLSHDSSLFVSKADLLFICDFLVRVQGLFTSFGSADPISLKILST